MHPRYVYLLPEWHQKRWWVPVEGDGVNCTEEEMEEMVEHSLTITHRSLESHTAEDTMSSKVQ